jgi:hypothetical protein
MQRLILKMVIAYLLGRLVGLIVRAAVFAEQRTYHPVYSIDHGGSFTHPGHYYCAGGHCYE